MRFALRKSLLLAICLLAVSSFAAAEVITFGSLPGNGTPIPNGFAGFNWLNFYDMNRAMTQSGSAATAATAFAYNNGGGPATFSASDTFTLNSAWLGLDGSVPMTIEVLGLHNGTVADRMMLVLNSAVPIQETFNWSGIDGVRFVPQVSAASNSKLQFALTQVTISGVTSSVPEPASMLLLGSGAGLVITRLRKNRSAR